MNTSKKILIITIVIVIAVVAGFTGFDKLSKSMKENWVSKQYEGELSKEKVEGLSFKIPSSFEVDESGDNYLTVMDSTASDDEDDQSHGRMRMSVSYEGLFKKEREVDSNIKKEYPNLQEKAKDISGEGYSGKEVFYKKSSDSGSYRTIIDYVIVDDSVFKLEIDMPEEYYSEKNLKIVRDHFDWTKYKSNRIAEIKAEYTGEAYPGDIVEKEDLSVKVVRENGETTDLVEDEFSIECPKGDIFKSKKSLKIVITCIEAGKEYKTTIDCKCEEEPDDSDYDSDDSSSSYSNGHYSPGDENGEAWDTNDDGSVSGNEYQDAVNDYMTEHGY